MPPISKSISDLTFRSAKPAAKPYRLFAGGGLYLEVSPTGAKYWRLKYRVAGREKRLSLGVYPEVSFREAQNQRDKHRIAIRNGQDPSAERQSEKIRRKASVNNSFEAVAREWLELKAHEWTLRQHDKERDRLHNHAFPWIGKLPIDTIGVGELRPLLLRIVKRGHFDQAHRLRHELSRIFRFAVATERATRDPAADLRDTLPARSKRNYATITDPLKIGELLRAIDAFGGTFPTACALKLAPLWFVRPGEIRAAEWSEFDLPGRQWTIPPSRRKLKKPQKIDPATPPHIVPLSSQALSILDDLKAVTGGGRFLFPGARDPRRPMSDNTINAALRRLGYGKEDMTGHGFRHMASTRLNELGWHSDVIERQLSHKEPGVRGVYNKAEHFPERCRMMQAWADYLDSLRASDGAGTAQNASKGDFRQAA